MKSNRTLFAIRALFLIVWLSWTILGAITSFALHSILDVIWVAIGPDDKFAIGVLWLMFVTGLISSGWAMFSLYRWVTR